MKTERVNLRTSADLKEKAGKCAELENRTLTNWIENLIKREIERIDKQEKV